MLKFGIESILIYLGTINNLKTLKKDCEQSLTVPVNTHLVNIDSVSSVIILPSTLGILCVQSI